MKVVACIIARVTSSRLPLKILRHVYDDVSLIDFIVKRIKQVDLVDEVVICTSNEPIDDVLEDIAIKNKVSIFRGDPDAVIDRMLKVGGQREADILIRITGDNVFTSFEYLNSQIEILIKNNLDYVRIIDVPIGATAEVIRKEALEDCYQNMDPSVSEYLLLFIFQPERYRCGVVKVTKEDSSGITLTVDTPRDLIRTKNILSHYSSKPKEDILLSDILQIIDAEEIEDAFFTSEGVVKLPYGETIAFKDFVADMNNRKSNSQQFSLVDEKK